MAKGASCSLKAFLFIAITLLVSGSFAIPAASASSFSPSVAHRTLKSPNVQSGGSFGKSVATNGGLVVVGAPNDTYEGFPGVGNVYVFNATTGSLAYTLNAPESYRYQRFGYSVAIGSVIVVGTPYVNYGNGAAYVFNSTTGALISTLTSPDPQEYGEFGLSVATSGNIAVVGAPFESSNGLTYAGNAYVFNAETGALITSLTSPNAQASGLFGQSVATNGKVAVVGAPYENSEDLRLAGNVYIFNAVSGNLNGNLSSPHAWENGLFGYSVAISGSSVVVGAPFEESEDHEFGGNVYIFNSNSDVYLAGLTSPNPARFGYFGWSVAISGNVVAVGAYRESSNGHIHSGNAYTYNVRTGELIRTLTSHTEREFGHFGWSVAISGKVVVVGAPHEKIPGHEHAGLAYIF